MVEPVLVNPWSSVMTPSVDSSLEISTPGAAFYRWDDFQFEFRVTVMDDGMMCP